MAIKQSSASKKRVAGKLQWAVKHRIEDGPPKEPAQEVTPPSDPVADAAQPSAHAAKENEAERAPQSPSEITPHLNSTALSAPSHTEPHSQSHLVSMTLECTLTERAPQEMANFAIDPRQELVAQIADQFVDQVQAAENGAGQSNWGSNVQQQDEVSNASSVNQPSAFEASFIPGQAPQAVAKLHMDEPENNLQVMTNGQSSRAQLLQETARELMGVLTRLSGNLGGMGHNQNIVLNFPAFRVQMQGNNIQTVQIRLNEEGNSSRGHNMLIGNNLPFDMDRETVGETGNQGTSQIGPFLLNQGTTESQPSIVSNAEAPTIIRPVIKHTYVRKLKKKHDQPNQINVFQAPPTSSKVGTKRRRTQDGQPDVESSIRRSERLKAKS